LKNFAPNLMIDQYLTAQQIWFMHCPRHWSPASEQYTGADSLITALRKGWLIDAPVSQHNFLHSGGRITAVYTFTLRLDTEVRQMAIISTPLIVRLLTEGVFTVLAQDEEDNRVRDSEESLLSAQTAV
jgi:hypothetical protein